MGQFHCSKGSGASPRSRSASASSSGSLTVLPDEALYLGLCWLSASTRESFSPSRWLPSSAATVARGRRPNAARCFSISKALAKSAARKKNTFMVANKLTIHDGLSLTSHRGVSLAAFALTDIAGKAKVRVGGVHVDVDTVAAEASGEPSACARFVTIVAFWRAEIEMDPKQYAVLKYQRHPVRAPPATEEDRQQFGEGCLTGLRYGAYAVLLSDAPIERHVQRAIEKVLPSDTDVTLERACEGASDTNAGRVRRVVIHDSCSTGEPSLSCGSDLELQAALDKVTQWCTVVYSSARCWAVVSLFLQRYEAIGECLLKASASQLV